MTDHQLPRNPQSAKKRRIGEQLMSDGLISPGQLQEVLRRQAQAGGQLGSILIEMGFVALDDLLELLSRRFGVPGVNLYQRNIAREVLQLLPVEKMAAKKVLPIGIEDQTVDNGHGQSPGLCHHQ
jgi:twitching motility protein PilT